MLEQDAAPIANNGMKKLVRFIQKRGKEKKAPLRQVDIHDPWPTDLENIKSDIFTPTFVLIDKDQEIGRLRGYAGDEFFWFLLDELMEKLE